MDKQNWKKLTILLVGLPLFYTFSVYSWWWIGSVREFLEWYHRFGFFIWGAKLLAISIYGVVLIVFFNKYFIFLLYVVFSLLLKNEHPFSNLPMYNTFPKYSLVFYIQNRKGKMFNHGIKYKSTDISDLYDAYMERNKLNEESLSEKDFQKIGKEIMSFVKEKNEKNVKGCFQVIKVKNIIRNKTLEMEKDVLYEECF